MLYIAVTQEESAQQAGNKDSATELQKSSVAGPVAQRLEQWTHNPPNRSAQPSPDTALAETSKSDLARHLAQTVLKHPELAELVKVWPELSEAKRQEILETMKRPQGG